jgi:hypothetical protein
MEIFQTTRLTLRWSEIADLEAATVARHDLAKYLEPGGNTQGQIDHWLSYAPDMTALQGETLAEVIETEASKAKIQDRVR